MTLEYQTSIVELKPTNPENVGFPHASRGNTTERIAAMLESPEAEVEIENNEQAYELITEAGSNESQLQLIANAIRNNRVLSKKGSLLKQRNFAIVALTRNIHFLPYLDKELLSNQKFILGLLDPETLPSWEPYADYFSFVLQNMGASLKSNPDFILNLFNELINIKDPRKNDCINYIISSMGYDLQKDPIFMAVLLNMKDLMPMEKSVILRFIVVVKDNEYIQTEEAAIKPDSPDFLGKIANIKDWTTQGFESFDVANKQLINAIKEDKDNFLKIIAIIAASEYKDQVFESSEFKYEVALMISRDINIISELPIELSSDKDIILTAVGMYHSPSEPAEGIQQILVDYRTQMQNCAIMQILFHANIDDQEVIISGLREFGVPAELIGQFRIIIATK